MPLPLIEALGLCVVLLVHTNNSNQCRASRGQGAQRQPTTSQVVLESLENGQESTNVNLRWSGHRRGRCWQPTPGCQCLPHTHSTYTIRGSCGGKPLTARPPRAPGGQRRGRGRQRRPHLQVHRAGLQALGPCRVAVPRGMHRGAQPGAILCEGGWVAWVAWVAWVDSGRSWGWWAGRLIVWGHPCFAHPTPPTHTVEPRRIPTHAPAPRRQSHVAQGV
jgi:hypothetical protein